MLKNYLKIAWRNLTQHKSYSLINLTGLAVGMACCLLIGLYMREELSFDDFHDNADRIAAIGSSSSFFGQMLATPWPLADALPEEIPQVEAATRVTGTGSLNLSTDGQNFTEVSQGKYSDPAFFDIFSFEMLSGSESEALAAPNSIVLSRSSAEQLFGEGTDPMGETLWWQKRDTLLTLEVTGVIQDEPLNSSIGYDALVSSRTMSETRRSPDSWNSYSYYTYALLRSTDDFEAMEEQLRLLVESHYEPNDEGEYSQEYFATPITELHLSDLSRDEGFTGNRAYLYLFGSVALFILIIACVNYVNLATARASLRAKEVGVRKSLGARRLQLAGQFVGESMILSVGAYLLGAVLAMLALPWFNELFGTHLDWSSGGAFLAWLVLAAAAVGLLAGLYPSLYLSRFAPVTVLRNQKSRGSSGSLLRKALVVGQFAIALVLIIGSMVVYRQLQFTQNKDLGFDGEQVVTVDLSSQDAWNQRESIASGLRGYTGIETVSASGGVPGEFNIRFSNPPSSYSSEAGTDTEKAVTIAPATVDEYLIPLLDIELVAGSNFSSAGGADAPPSYIINRKAAELLGWTPEEAVGKAFSIGSAEGKLVGVTEDFHISSLHSEIEAIVLMNQESSNFYGGGYIVAELAPDRISEAMDRIEEVVAPFSPNSAFTYEFLDDKFDAMYRTERRFGRVVGLFTFVAIVIASLGLYGLAAFSAERRVKEIGVRKVMGATVTNIVTLLSRDFLKLVMLGFVIAIPVAYYVMNQWLADFAYRIDIGAGVFVLAGLGAVLLALLTVSWQSVRAATTNPAEALRSE
ncbi:MAG: ABC transporter permease [Balneolaceae bacterium]|nr:ABC transporter permease [Balneolaceae bacterium]